MVAELGQMDNSWTKHKLAKLGDAIAISKSETVTDWLTDPPTDRGNC